MTVMTKSTTPNNAILVVCQGRHNLASLANSTNATRGSVVTVFRRVAPMDFGASANSKSSPKRPTPKQAKPVIPHSSTALAKRVAVTDRITTATGPSMRHALTALVMTTQIVLVI